MPRRDSGATRRQRERERRRARSGIEALVWLFYEKHRDAVELDHAFLGHLRALGVAVGLPPLDVHTTLAAIEVQINSDGGVRATDGTFHRVHTSDRWLTRQHHDLARTPDLLGDSPPCPDATCPRWQVFRS